MLIKHIHQQDKILVIVDCDADGYTSASALINYLNYLFPAFTQNNIDYYIHSGKQHGLEDDCVQKALNNNYKLVICPDSSSNDYEQHKILFDNNIDVLVIDHHEAEKISENACVINNQLCDYPTKSLSGAGMVYKFCSYIDSLLGLNYADKIIDLAALGIIADMMDLRDYETRAIVTKGLDNILNPFFKQMVDDNSYSLRNEVTPIGVAFYIAPSINATIRVGTPEEKELLFQAMLNFKSYEEIPSTKRGHKDELEFRVTQACRNCVNIKKRQTKLRDENLNTIEALIAEKGLLKNKILLIQINKENNIDKNLTGLIANQLMAKYQRPVLLLNEYVDETGEKTWEGSGRGYGKSELNDFRKFIAESNFAIFAEGHSNAFGSGFNDNNIEPFISYCNNELKSISFEPCYIVDFIFQSEQLQGADIIKIAGLKSYWGQGFDESSLAIENIKITNNNVTLMSKDKNPTLKISLPNGIDLIKFKSSEEEYNKLQTELGCITINIVGKCEKNEWNGVISPQIIIEDYEIVGCQKYYF